MICTYKERIYSERKEKTRNYNNSSALLACRKTRWRWAGPTENARQIARRLFCILCYYYTMRHYYYHGWRFLILIRELPTAVLDAAVNNIDRSLGEREREMRLRSQRCGSRRPRVRASANANAALVYIIIMHTIYGQGHSPWPSRGGEKWVRHESYEHIIIII